jgi:hypothetical protein
MGYTDPLLKLSGTGPDVKKQGHKPAAPHASNEALEHLEFIQ